MSDMIRRHITFYGRVQRAGFRYTAQYAASNNNCTGWDTGLKRYEEMMTNKRKKIITITVLLSGFIIAAACILLFFQIPCRFSAGSYQVKGIDVSHYQGNIDWNVIKDQGIKFAYIKATEGSTYTDEYYHQNHSEAVENGISVGAYHFFSFDSKGETQAGHFIETTGQQDGMLIPAVDVEYYGDKKKNPPDGQELRRELSAMLDILEEHYGCKPLIYSTQSFYHKYLEGYYDEYPLWIRNVYLPPAQEWVIWQYCDKLKLDGVNGDEQYVDGDVCIGDLSLLDMP